MKTLQRIAFIGTHLPRRCGIATFTHDLHEAVATACPVLETSVVALTDRGGGYDYPPGVTLEVRDQFIGDYAEAAEFLNGQRYDVVSLQHEYGIFGGEAGGHIGQLLSRLQMPIVTTLHTVLKEPSQAQRVVMSKVIDASTKLVVMANKARELLQSVHHVPASKIAVIPHGIPDFPFLEPDLAKSKLGFSGKTVILTFGLLSPSKGIETVIDALPAIVASCPDTVYVVLGATHPNLVREQGEAYRERLMARAADHGVSEHVVFINQFVDQATLLEYISMCDLYVTPYLNEAQMTSGTLAYSFGLGKAVVSTPYWHATELLADGRGSLVPFGDATAIGAEITALLTNDGRRNALRKRAYAASRSMTWGETATHYLTEFEKAQEATRTRSIVLPTHVGSKRMRRDLPAVSTQHFLAMCDSTGLLQHAVYAVPDRSHGYCVDDNARALLLSVALGASREARLSDVYTTRFAAFIQHAWNPDTQRFRNFMSYDRRWLEDVGSEDSHARTLWALGECAGRDHDLTRRRWAHGLFKATLPVVDTFGSPRAWAFTLLGLAAYAPVVGDDPAADRVRSALADRLLQLFAVKKPRHWIWFEDVLAYDNARLPQALIQTGVTLQEPEYIAVGLRSLKWLMDMQTAPSGCFRPVGSQSFGQRYEQPTAFDQQPIEAAATIAACLAAARASGGTEWPAHALRAFHWFVGANDLQIPLIDAATGFCCDGLHPDRANANGGAESVLSYLLGLVELREFERAALATQALPMLNWVHGTASAFAPTPSQPGSRLVPTQILEPPFTAPAARPGTGRRQTVQTGH
jgi:glycosyltransferase involved in cell wall biosynthesis